jgi:Tol biopolymer transport system component
VRGTISPDGAYVYYHDDQKGNEVGHTVRVPFEGGTPEDITPDLPLYEVAGFSFSHTGNRLGFTTITPEGFDVYCVDVGSKHILGQRSKLRHSDVLTYGPDLSYNGEIVAVTTADHPGTLRYSIIAFDTTTGQQIGRLSDDDGSVELHMFSPLADDMRLLGTTDRSGVKRPLLWNVETGERVDIPPRMRLRCSKPTTED